MDNCGQNTELVQHELNNQIQSLCFRAAVLKREHKTMSKEQITRRTLELCELITGFVSANENSQKFMHIREPSNNAA